MGPPRTAASPVFRGLLLLRPLYVLNQIVARASPFGASEATSRCSLSTDAKLRLAEQVDASHNVTTPVSLARLVPRRHWRASLPCSPALLTLPQLPPDRIRHGLVTLRAYFLLSPT